MNIIYEIGIQIIQVLQSVSPAFDSLMHFFRFLGTIDFYLLVIPILYWIVRPSLGIRVLFLLVATDYLGLCSKQPLPASPRL